MPNLEDGYTRIANELLDAIISFGFSKREFAILFCVIRKTYGYNKKMDDLSLSQISRATKLDAGNISKAIKSLTDCKVLSKQQGKYGYLIGINKNYNEWSYCQNDKVVKTTNRGCQNNNLGLLKQQFSVVKTTTTKDNNQKTIPKDNNQKTYSCAFLRFWAAYPKKKSKGQAWKAWKKINPDERLVDLMVSIIELAKTSDDWLEKGGKYIPHPATWLNAEGWEDEIKLRYNDDRNNIQSGQNGQGKQFQTSSERFQSELDAWVKGESGASMGGNGEYFQGEVLEDSGEQTGCDVDEDI